tara:strand:+ start:1760 stop:2800 length:1041 start_codon:yes stop_codon:yes gene_type:complete
MPDYGGDKGFGSNKDDPGKDRNTGGNKPGQGSGYNTGNTNTSGGGGGSYSALDDFSYRPTQTNYLGTQDFEQDFSSTSQDYDPSKHTNSIIEAMFSPDLTFKYNPQMDYVNRVYGGLRPDQKQRILNQVDPKGIFGGNFGSFVDANYGNLYDAGNITGQNIADAFTSVSDYFTGIPNAIANYDPTMPTQEGFKTLGQKVFGGIFGNPVTTFMGMNPLGFPVGMFASLVANKGPFTQESIESGDFANLANAPADYQKAVQQAMGGTFSPEQMAQIASGMAAKAEEQANTKTGVEPTAEEKAELQAQMDKQSIEAYKNTLTEPQLRVYERLAGQGYNDDYIRAYLGFL